MKNAFAFFITVVFGIRCGPLYTVADTFEERLKIRHHSSAKDTTRLRHRPTRIAPERL
jgi:hypothetical protein